MRLTRKVYTTRNEKILDFVIGFIGWFMVNGLMYACSVSIISNLDSGSDTLQIGLLALPLVINIVGLILLSTTRRWIALGALAAFALLLVGVLLIGLLVYAICFNTNTFQ